MLTYAEHCAFNRALTPSFYGLLVNEIEFSFKPQLLVRTNNAFHQFNLPGNHDQLIELSDSYHCQILL